MLILFKFQNVSAEFAVKNALLEAFAGVADGRRDFVQLLLVYFHVGFAEPFAVELANHGTCGLRGIIAFGVLDGAEFFFAHNAEREHGTQLRECVKEELFELEALFDAANGLAGGVPRELARLQLAKSADFKQVNSDVAAVEREAAIGVCHVAVVFRKVAVFDNARLLVLEGENADFFVRACLVHDLRGAEDSAFFGERSDECRVANAAEGVIDTVKEYVLHAMFHEPSERSTLGECAEASAISIRNECQMVFAIEDCLSVSGEGANGALFKETDVFAVQAKEIVFAEEVDCRFVIERARHDAPRNRVTNAGAQVAQTFCLQLEQTLVARKPNVEHALRAVETETGTLSACNEECSDFTLAQKNLAGLFPKIVTEIVCREFPRHRREVRRNVVA